VIQSIEALGTAVDPAYCPTSLFCIFP